MNLFGRHVIAELRGANFEDLNNATKVVNTLIEAAKKAGATVMSYDTVIFDPQGCSAVVILAESHVTIHTFPEEGYASFDAYTCGQQADPLHILLEVIEGLGVTACEHFVIHRGLANGMEIA
jgi:S-adenosylmethionine decarboxylase